MRRHVVYGNLYDAQRWEWTFNATPRMCSITWDTIKPEENMQGNPLPKHLTWALMFMNLYLTEVISTSLAGADEKTFRKWVWLFVEAIEAKTYDVIRFERRLENRNGNVCTISVDGVDFAIMEPRPNWNNKRRWSGYFSEKFNGPGLRYEIGMCISTGNFVWVNGPFPAAYSDLQIFRKDLIDEMGEGEKVVADQGYNGEKDYIVTSKYLRKMGELGQLDDYFKVRARHECGNRRLKVWNILGHRFRHGLHKHGMVFRAVAVIEQLKMDNGSPMFPVVWEDYGLGILEMNI